MRCMACGAEMILMTVIEDETMPIPLRSPHPLCLQPPYFRISSKRLREL
jgi:hypothetical protein